MLVNSPPGRILLFSRLYVHVFVLVFVYSCAILTTFSSSTKKFTKTQIEFKFLHGHCLHHLTNISSGFHNHSGFEVYVVLEQYEYLSK